jgi:hypothetical protein
MAKFDQQTLSNQNAGALRLLLVDRDLVDLLLISV